jgi:UDP-galactopyranose mutase
MLTRVGVPVTSEAEPSAPDPEPATLICFSHLRWNFVFQRPQHLMSRFAREMNVIFWEEPMTIGRRETAYLQVREAADAPNVRVAVPHLPEGMPEDAREAAL